MTFIEPMFRCDYGFNIHTEGLVFINYNCVMLDTSPIHIGENAFIGPGTCLTCAGHAIDAKNVVWVLELLSQLHWRKMYG